MQPERPGVGSLLGVPEPSAFVMNIRHSSNTERGSDQKAILRPSGDQEGSCAYSPSGVGRTSWLQPPASVTTTLSTRCGGVSERLPPLALTSTSFTKAIFRPSGEKAGASSLT